MEIRFLGCLLMGILLMSKGFSLDVTFSSKLIHRFSDEVKAFRVSRNGNVSGSWPKHKSMNYYQMLVRSDLQRQKMKLGAQYQFLLPSEGSKTMSFGNDFGWLHYAWIDIGTPNVSFLVALDAGSDLLWVPCDCIQCAPLSASHYNSLDRDLSEYSPSGSSTSKHLSCSHELCELGSKCKNPNQPCPYISNYYSENTSSSGFLVEDTLHLASKSVHASKSLVQAPVIIGCGRKQSGGYLDGTAPDGLMGLGLGDISVISFLAKAGLVRNSFSMCFDEDDSGRIFFGDQGVTGQQSTSFLPLDEKYITYMVGVERFCIGSICLKQTGFQAQVDSGTSFTFLPENVYEKVVVEFDKRVKATRSSEEGSPLEYCYQASSEELLKMPNLTLVFPLNNSFVVHNPTLLIYGDEGVTGFCLAIQPAEGKFGTIGQNFMTGYRIVFDRENLKLRWSRSIFILVEKLSMVRNLRIFRSGWYRESPRYSSHTSYGEDLTEDKKESQAPPQQDGPENPLPTNEQQSTPGGRAVAPAVAGRTPTKPSAASRQLILSQFCMPSLLLQLSLLLFI